MQLPLRYTLTKLLKPFLHEGTILLSSSNIHHCVSLQRSLGHVVGLHQHFHHHVFCGDYDEKGFQEGLGYIDDNKKIETMALKVTTMASWSSKGNWLEW